MRSHGARILRMTHLFGVEIQPVLLVYKMYVLICDTFCLTCTVVFSYMNFVDLPLLVVVKALLSLCCVMFHIYDAKINILYLYLRKIILYKRNKINHVKNFHCWDSNSHNSMLEPTYNVAIHYATDLSVHQHRIYSY